MSCPDPNPEPGSVQDLENQKYQLERRIREKKNADYIYSGKLESDLNELCIAVNLTKREQAGKTWEELIKTCIEKAKKTNAAYTESLWAK